MPTPLRPSPPPGYVPSPPMDRAPERDDAPRITVLSRAMPGRDRVRGLTNAHVHALLHELQPVVEAKVEARIDLGRVEVAVTDRDAQVAAVAKEPAMHATSVARDLGAPQAIYVASQETLV